MLLKGLETLEGQGSPSLNLSKYLRLEDISDHGLQIPEQALYCVLLVSTKNKDCSSLIKQLPVGVQNQLVFSSLTEPDATISRLEHENFDAVVISIDPQAGKELGLLTTIKKMAPDLPVIVLADYKHRELASQAIKKGAHDFLVVDSTTPLELLRMRVSSIIQKEKAEIDKLGYARLEKFVLRSVVENSPLLFVRFDHSFNIIDCNKFFEQKLGATRQELRGRSMFEVLQQVEFEEFQQLAMGQPLLSKRLTLRGEKDNSYVDTFFNFFSWSFARANSQESEIILLGVDITGSVKSKYLQEEFVAAIAHDLRNPILGHEQVFSAIIDKNINPYGDMTDSLRAIRSSNLKVLQLLDTLLDVYKMDSSERIPRVEGACFNEAVHSQIGEMQLVADTGQQKIHLKLDSNLPKAAIDQVSAFRIVSNLLFNAVKNSPKKAEITVSTRANEDSVILEISNPPIAAQSIELANMFERFAFANRQEGHKRSTSGLGLYFCKKTLDNYNGSITCIQERDPSVVTFIVSVPLLK